MKSKILKSEFFDRDPVVVAKDLLGKYLVRELRGRRMTLEILETEAYLGEKDKASHASRGQTPRNTPMFLGPGIIYVYFTYGMHFMFNIVCGKSGDPGAVLIRGVSDCIGPGRLTKRLGINKNLNSKPLGKKFGLWIEEGKDLKLKRKIIKTSRVGVDYAGPVWSKKLYRFVLLPSKVR